MSAAPSRRTPSPSVATFLSFLWPGLGQWYAARYRPALVFAVPVIVIAVLLVGLVVGGLEGFAIRLLDPGFAIAALVLVLLLGAWRLVAMGDALAGFGGRRAFRGPAGALFAGLAVVVIAASAWGGYLAWSFYDASTHIFQPGPPVTATGPTPTGNPSTSAFPSQDYQMTPLETPPTASSRINILMTGIDSSERRTHALNDTLIVVSIDPATRAVSMVSLPRDIAQFPLWDGRIFHGKINSLMTYANLHPTEYPAGGLATLIREVGYLLGIPIHYYAAIDLQGFVSMIDAVGGVTVDNPRAIDDPNYGGWTDGRPIGFHLTVGKHTLDGQTALAFARSRKGAGDNDFTRARRQQELLVALRDKLTDPVLLPKLPGILQAAGRTIKTNFPQDRLNEMLDLGRQIGDKSVKTVVLGPPYAVHPPDSQTGGTYILKLVPARVRALSVQLYGVDSRYVTAGGDGVPWFTPDPSLVGGGASPSPSRSP